MDFIYIGREIGTGLGSVIGGSGGLEPTTLGDITSLILLVSIHIQDSDVGIGRISQIYL